MSNSISSKYQHLLNLLMEIKQRINSAQYEALKVVNRELINLYWDIGRMIFAQRQNNSWSKSVVKLLAQDLQTEFPGISGFSPHKIWNIGNFYFTYSQNAKLQSLAAEIQ